MTIYRLYVVLLDIAPPIWRRIELSSEISLAQLHKVLQAAMRWEDYHLYEFDIGGRRYGVPEEDDEQPQAVAKDHAVKLSKALVRKGDSLRYTYEFGDDRTHSVVLEDILLIEPETKYPRIVDGARACPPEDCGGPPGYADLLEILAKPRHKDHRQMREWAGEHFDPKKFSAKAANLLLKPALPKKALSQPHPVQ